MSAQGSAAAEVAAPATFDALPLSLALLIFALLPADARLLAAAVCRAWRVMLADPALWTRLDLTSESGVRVCANPTLLLRAAAARAGGQLKTLRVTLFLDQPHQELLAVLALNAATMRELALCPADFRGPPCSTTVAALLRATPGLRLLETGVTCRDADALPLLRKEEPFGPLQLKRFTLRAAAAFGWRALADCLMLHTSLESVELEHGWPQAQAASDAVIVALVSLPLLRSLTVYRAPAPALARLLGCPALTSLRMHGMNVPLLGSPASTALLCDALRANVQLETLEIFGVQLWRDVDAAATLLATLQTHPSLQVLKVPHNVAPPEHAAAAGTALGALITHSHTLRELDITQCAFGDAGLGLIVDALPRARHLQTLNITGNNMSETFARERLLPALRAGASLRELYAGDSAAQHEADMLLWERL